MVIGSIWDAGKPHVYLLGGVYIRLCDHQLNVEVTPAFSSPQIAMVAEMDSPNLDSPRTYGYPPASLNQDDILGVFQRSPDNGITLVFSKMNLSNVGAAATEKIVSMGMKHTEGEGSVKRQVCSV